MQPEITLENYEEQRRALLEANANLNGIVLREQERELDARLSALKLDFIQSCGSSSLYDIPVLAEPELCSTPLYRFCSRLPKGADLHVHDMALLPPGELIPLLRSCPEFCINADRRSFDLKCTAPDGSIPEGYLRFSEAMSSGYYTEPELMASEQSAPVSGSGTALKRCSTGRAHCRTTRSLQENTTTAHSVIITAAVSSTWRSI